VRTRIQVLTTPAGAEQAPTRKQLLDRVDGVVFVADARRERLSENLASFEELRSVLSAYGRSPEQVPLVLQYNKRDLSDPYALEELHRKLGLRGVAAFEAVAREGSAVLQTLTTISKRVIRHRREQAEREAGEPDAPSPQSPPLGTTQLVMRALELEPEPLAAGLEAEAEPTPAAAELSLEPPFQEAPRRPELPDVSDLEPTPLEEPLELGEPRLAGPRSVSVPVHIRDAAGNDHVITLRIQIEAALEPTP
jgi:hypothetical protein